MKLVLVTISFRAPSWRVRWEWTREWNRRSIDDPGPRGWFQDSRVPPPTPWWRHIREFLDVVNRKEIWRYKKKYEGICQKYEGIWSNYVKIWRNMWKIWRNMSIYWIWHSHIGSGTWKNSKLFLHIGFGTWQKSELPPPSYRLWKISFEIDR